MMLRLEVVTKKIKFRVCMPMVGSQYTSKLYIKTGAMLYIKVLLWTPAECMQRGTLTRKGGESDVLLLFSNTAASQRCRTSEFQRGVGSQCNRPSSPSSNSAAQNSKVTWRRRFSATLCSGRLCQHASVLGSEGNVGSGTVEDEALPPLEV